MGLQGEQIIAVNPTCVGMDRMASMTPPMVLSKPHVRGDGPSGDVAYCGVNA